MIPTPFEIFMFVAMLLMFIALMTLIVCFTVSTERHAKHLMSKNLMEYEATRKPNNGSKPTKYMTDEDLYYQDKLKSENFNKDLQNKIEALKAEEEAFTFNVERNG